MKKEEIHLWDWERILIGNAPWEFMLEVLLRTLIIYLLLLIAVRLLGKRMSANISIFEMAVMLTLGAIVSVPMQTPDRGLLQGIVILACEVILYRSLIWLTVKSRKIELITQGDVSLLVKDGIINVKELKGSTMSHEQLFAQLRGKQLRNLGEVKRVYLEACGIFSVYKNNKPQPGLCILPSKDEKIFNSQPRSHTYVACKNCGNIIEASHKASCENCGVNDWDQAVAVDKEDAVKTEKYITHSY